jgi:hypothetical protein
MVALTLTSYNGCLGAFVMWSDVYNADVSPLCLIVLLLLLSKGR